MTHFQSFEVTSNPADAPPRVAELRKWMEEQNLDAFLVPRADRYQGEYVAPCDDRLAWITGFTGSAGFAVILRDSAALFTDGRYTVQVRAQTDPSTFDYVDWPATKLVDWLPDSLPKGGRVGFDPWLHTTKELDTLSAFTMIPTPNGIDAIWQDRPAPPSATVTLYPDALAGRTQTEKRAQIADAIKGRAEAFVTTQPDAVCWLLNIRGADIARTPIVQAMAVIHADASVDVIADPTKFTELDLDIRVTDEPDTLLKSLGKTGYDPATTPVALRDLLVDAVAMDDPIALPKACKTDAEIAATREAHLRDATAMIRFLRWVDEQGAGKTEIDVVRQLETFRRETNQLREISFETIAGAGPNGAIVHYRVNEDTNRPLDENGLLLVDSGGQYIDGTTDITRTIALGQPPEQAAHDFTRVLQGMIAVSRARFPVGVAGAHLDALARAPLWAEHKDYDHGTGHGVGVYLGVHEGPVRISRVSNIPLAPGMILSNEPGYYREGAYGIRIENLIVVQEADRLEGGDDRKMLGFETLTWVPIDRRLIVTSLLNRDELRWINNYHETVLSDIGPRLPSADLNWLRQACAPL